MNNKITKILGALTLIIAIMSCNKNWLTPEPLSFFTPENTFTNESGFESLLVSMRKNLKYQSYGVGAYEPITAEFTTSDLAVNGYDPDFSDVTPNGSTGMPFLAMFDRWYEFIKDANTLISRVEEADLEEDVKNQLLARAYFHRSYWYYLLVNDYGDVPWIGEELNGAKLDFQTYSRWAILDKLKSDMSFAVEHLAPSEEPGVPTLGAGNHLLAKICLANTDFDGAIEAATKVIDGPYDLMKHRFGIDAGDNFRNVIWDLHRPENISDPSNTETILATIDRPDAPLDARIYAYRAGNFEPHYWDVADESGARGIVYPPVNSQMDTLLRGQGVTVNSAFYQFRIWEDENYTWEATPDLRRSDINWTEMSEIVYDVPTSPNYGEPIQQLWPAPSDTTLRWYSWPRYLTYNRDNLESNTWSGGNGDLYIYRLAETYLIRAEAYYWKGESQLAADDINEIRERVHAPMISSDDIDLNLIFNERGRELYAEEMRHAEMVRAANIMAKLEFDGYSLSSFSSKNWWYDKIMLDNDIYEKPQGTWWQGQTVTIQPFNVYWPIPQSIITANTLGRVNQNEGYIGFENNVSPIEHIED